MADDPEYQRWNTRYAQPAYLFGTEPNQFLAQQGHRLKAGAKALALADGEGRNGVWLARQGLDVLSLDFSPAAQEKARLLAARHGVTITTELADLAHWTWPPARFDIVAAIMIQVSKPPLQGEIFRGMKSVLKPGGLVILQGYRPEQLGYRTGGPPDAENMYTEELLRAAFADMRILHLSAHDDAILEGQGHHGMSALIDMVAQKA
jgi:cyclopropane fatty-acyl-phospholipid synthase-like methyltransferase